MTRSAPAVLILLTALMAAGPSAAASKASRIDTFEQRCEREMKPMVEATARDHGYRVDNTVSSRRLIVLSRHHYAGDLMMGMTARRAHALIDVAGSSLTDKPGKRECIAPQVAVEVLMPQLDVYVAREFSPFSCPFRQVLQHEMRHVQLYRDGLPGIASRIQAELEKRYAGRPYYAAHGAGLSTLHAEVTTWLGALVRNEFDELERRQIAMDTREESYSLSLSCDGGLSNELGHR